MKLSPLAQATAPMLPVLLSFGAAPVLANPIEPHNLQSDAITPGTNTTDERLVVVGDRFARTADTVLAPVVVLDRSDIDAMQANSLTEVLRTLPSVDVNQFGGRGQLATLSVRGATSSQTLVLVDGMRLASASIGPANLNTIPLAQIERVEYLRGARASVYGSEAVSGVINLITRGGAVGADASLSLGSDEYQSYQGRYQGELGPGEIKLVAGYEDEEGYNVHPVPGVNDGDKHGYTGKHAMLAYDAGFGPAWQLYGALRWHQDESQYDNSSVGNPEWGTPDVQAGNETWMETWDGQAELRYQSDHWQSRWQAQFGDSDSYDYPDDQHRNDAANYTHLRQLNLAWLNQWVLNHGITLGAGADWRRESLEDDSTVQDFFTGGAMPFADGDIERDNTGIYALARLERSGHQLEASLRSDDNEQYGRENTWQLGGALAINAQWRMVASVGTAFRAPSFFDLYYPGFANPDLAPETSDNYELALEADLPLGQWRLGAFRQEADNLIQYDAATFRPENIGEARIQGVELEGQFDTGPVAHSLSYSWRDTEDKGNGNELTASARHNGKWHLGAELGDWYLSGDIIYRGSRYGDAANSVKLSPYWLTNLAVGYSFDHRWRLSARVENLLDEEYETVADTFSGGSYPGQGRSLYGEISMRL